MIDHGDGLVTLYGHCSSLSVSKGQSAKKGQKVAACGSTGLSTGPHLHWDLRIMDVPVNGMQWLEQAFP
jgi:murein DD-endopeptidase MepM/ murein hydrolase activator NlpD